MKKIKEIMTSDPICCTPQDSVTDVARLMKREDIGSVPVLKDRKTGETGRYRHGSGPRIEGSGRES